ncbi:MAG: metal ABC transporter substrate-binding protein [Magnetospirillum sp.]|nr:metal ABC transporter substrate-binding protein [Magnetospirillum sp.]
MAKAAFRTLLLALAVLAAAIGAARADESRPLRVVATFTILADMVRQVGDGRVAVTALVGPNGDAHVYEPTPADVRAVAEADLLVVNGLGMEGWLDRLGRAAGYHGPVVVASRGIAPREMSEDGRTAVDPHAWQDLADGRRYVQNIAEGLEKADPAHRTVYADRAARYSAELKDLDAWVRAEIGQVPPDKREVITTHDAFGYFGAAYGVRFLAPEGISTDAEVTAGDFAHLIRQIRRTGVKALFVENMSDPRLVRELADEAGVPVGGTLYVDALSPPDGPAPTYVDMFRSNVTQLVAAMERNRGE